MVCLWKATNSSRDFLDGAFVSRTASAVKDLCQSLPSHQQTLKSHLSILLLQSSILTTTFVPYVPASPSQIPLLALIRDSTIQYWYSVIGKYHQDYTSSIPSLKVLIAILSRLLHSASTPQLLTETQNLSLSSTNEEKAVILLH